MTNLDELMAGARDSITVKRVFGDPYEKNGVTFIPAAAVRGGGGVGEGDGGGSAPTGSGGGFGVMARPVGAYQIKDDEVTWVPAADTTRVIVVGEIIVIILVLVLRSIFRKRAKSKPSRK